MKISIVLGPFLSLPPNPTGAIERLWADLADRFSEQNHRVTLIGKDLGESTKAGVAYLKEKGETRSGWLWRDILRDGKYANRVVEKIYDADIVVTNSFCLPTVLGRMKRHGAKYKVVMNLARMPKGQLFLYHKVDKIAVVSQAVLEAVRQQDEIAYRKSVVIENPIDCTKFNNERRQNRNVRERTLLYVGRIAEEKGLEILINAFHALPKDGRYVYSLKIVGPHRVEEGGDGEFYLEKLKKFAKSARIGFYPPIWDRQELGNLYRSVDIFIYPSIAERGETFGIAPLEAMACGAVTIVSDLRCFSQFVRDGENASVAGILECNASVENLCRKIVELEDINIYNKLQKGGIETGRGYDSSFIAEKYLREFSMLMNSKM